eukprot:6694018-Pyramimonas_sp.AAC.1
MPGDLCQPEPRDQDARAIARVAPLQCEARSTPQWLGRPDSHLRQGMAFRGDRAERGAACGPGRPRGAH